MPTIDFPASPTVNQEFTSGGRTWIWNGAAWDSKGTVQAPGPANELSVGTVTTVANGTPAEVTITGESPAQTLSFTIPAGPQGPAGNLTNLAATSPILYNSGTSTLSFAGIALDDVTDVSAAAPNVGDVLYWNGTAWIPNPVIESYALANLSDVGTLTPSPGDVLYWNGTEWVNDPLVRTYALDDLTDVQLTGIPVVGDTMVYDGTKWVNAQPDAPLPTTFMMMGA